MATSYMSTSIENKTILFFSSVLQIGLSDSATLYTQKDWAQKRQFDILIFIGELSENLFMQTTKADMYIFRNECRIHLSFLCINWTARFVRMRHSILKIDAFIDFIKSFINRKFYSNKLLNWRIHISRWQIGILLIASVMLAQASP